MSYKINTSLLKIIESRLVDKNSPYLIFVNNSLQSSLSLIEDLNIEFHTLFSEIKNRCSKRELENLAELIDKQISNLTYISLILALFSIGFTISIKRNFNKILQIVHINQKEIKGPYFNQHYEIKIANKINIDIIEQFINLKKKSSYLNNKITIKIGAASLLNYYYIQEDDATAFSKNSLIIEHEFQARSNLHLYILNTQSSELNLYIDLTKREVKTVLYGLYYAFQNQKVKLQTNLSHTESDTHSFQWVKGVIADNAEGNFQGCIYIGPQSVRVESRQLNNNLIFSPTGSSISKPLIECYARDVNASHGATYGQIDENQVFYLTSRGITKQKAINLLIYVFINAIINKIENPLVQRHIRGIIKTRVLKSKRKKITY